MSDERGDIEGGEGVLRGRMGEVGDVGDTSPSSRYSIPVDITLNRSTTQ